MKKIIYIFIAIFTLTILNVKAETEYNFILRPESVPNRTYIIGSYMFTREVTPNYDGRLKTQDIINGSSSISSLINQYKTLYYKNIDGDWVNGITAETITPPAEFFIMYVNNDNVIDIDPKNIEIDVNYSPIKYQQPDEEDTLLYEISLKKDSYFEKLSHYLKNIEVNIYTNDTSSYETQLSSNSKTTIYRSFKDREVPHIINYGITIDDNPEIRTNEYNELALEVNNLEFINSNASEESYVCKLEKNSQVYYDNYIFDNAEENDEILCKPSFQLNETYPEFEKIEYKIEFGNGLEYVETIEDENHSYLSKTVKDEDKLNQGLIKTFTSTITYKNDEEGNSTKDFTDLPTYKFKFIKYKPAEAGLPLEQYNFSDYYIRMIELKAQKNGNTNYSNMYANVANNALFQFH